MEAKKKRENRTLQEKISFMMDDRNRELVLEGMTFVSDDVIEAMDLNFQDFLCRRTELMSERQIQEMERVIKRVRNSQVLVEPSTSN